MARPTYSWWLLEIYAISVGDNVSCGNWNFNSFDYCLNLFHYWLLDYGWCLLLSDGRVLLLSLAWMNNCFWLICLYRFCNRCFNSSNRLCRRLDSFLSNGFCWLWFSSRSSWLRLSFFGGGLFSWSFLWCNFFRSSHDSRNWGLWLCGFLLLCRGLLCRRLLRRSFLSDWSICLGLNWLRSLLDWVFWDGSGFGIFLFLSRFWGGSLLACDLLLSGRFLYICFSLGLRTLIDFHLSIITSFLSLSLLSVWLLCFFTELMPLGSHGLNKVSREF